MEPTINKTQNLSLINQKWILGLVSNHHGKIQFAFDGKRIYLSEKTKLC